MGLDFEHIIKDEIVYDVSDAVARAEVAKKQDQMQLTDLSPSSALLGRVVQYIGDTDAYYTRHYFYREDADIDQPTPVHATFTLVDQDQFNALLADVGQMTGQNVYSMDISVNSPLNTVINIYYLDENGDRVRVSNTFNTGQFTARTGLTYSGSMGPLDNPDSLDVLMAWTRVDVQPASSASNKVDKVSTSNVVYGTDNSGNQTTYSVNSFGQVDDVQVDGVSVVQNKIASIDLTDKIEYAAQIVRWREVS